MCWPVIDPLARYRYALKERGKPRPEILDQVIPLHEKYWPGEEAMARPVPRWRSSAANGSKGRLRCIFRATTTLSIRAPTSIASSPGYRKADGRVELELIEGEGEAFIARKSASPSAARAIARIIEFVHASMA